MDFREPLILTDGIWRHPEAKAYCLNAFLQEEPLDINVPGSRLFPSSTSQTPVSNLKKKRLVLGSGKAPDFDRKGLELMRETLDLKTGEGRLILGKRGREDSTVSQKRRKPAQSEKEKPYCFLDLPQAESEEKPIANLVESLRPSHINLLESLRKQTESAVLTLLQGVISCVSLSSGSEIYEIDVSEASPNLHEIFQRAQKTRLRLVHRGGESHKAGSQVLLVSPICIDPVSLLFVASAVQLSEKREIPTPEPR